MNIEGMKGAEVPLNHSDIEGKGFDQAYYDTLSELENKGESDLGDFLKSLSDGEKQNLESALNHNGSDWRFLNKLGKENSAAVIEAIQEWSGARAMAKNNSEIWKVDKAMYDELYDL